MCLKAWTKSGKAPAEKAALGYKRPGKQVHRRRRDTKIHVSIKFYTHFACQPVTMDYKGWFAYVAKGDLISPVIWTPSYGQRRVMERSAANQANTASMLNWTSTFIHLVLMISGLQLHRIRK